MPAALPAKRALVILVLLASLAALVFLGFWLFKGGTPDYTGKDKRKALETQSGSRNMLARKVPARFGFHA